jgi:hypothetical protein
MHSGRRNRAIASRACLSGPAHPSFFVLAANDVHNLYDELGVDLRAGLLVTRHTDVLRPDSLPLAPQRRHMHDVAGSGVPSAGWPHVRARRSRVCTATRRRRRRAREMPRRSGLTCGLSAGERRTPHASSSTHVSSGGDGARGVRTRCALAPQHPAGGPHVRARRSRVCTATRQRRRRARRCGSGAASRADSRPVSGAKFVTGRRLECRI